MHVYRQENNQNQPKLTDESCTNKTKSKFTKVTIIARNLIFFITFAICYHFFIILSTKVKLKIREYNKCMYKVLVLHC